MTRTNASYPCRVLLLISGLLSATLGFDTAAHAQSIYDLIQPGDSIAVGPSSLPESGKPRPIVGTVPYLNAFEADKTNNQLYGTVGFFERSMRDKRERLAAAAGAEDESGNNFGTYGGILNPLWAWELNVISEAVRVPSVNVDCHPDYRYAFQSVDLYAANSSLRIPLYSFSVGGESGYIGLFHAGGVTGRVLQNGSRVFQAYKFAGLGLLGTYFPPAVLAFEEDGGFQKISGDFIAGAEASLGAYGDIHLGYVWSSGLYTNATVDKLYLFGSAILDETLQSFPLLQAGLQGIRSFDGIGQTSLFGRQRDFETGASEALAEDKFDLKLTTGHIRQSNIELGGGASFSLEVAYAIEPEPFLHKAHGEFNWMLSELEPDMPLLGFHLETGIIDFPNQPFLGVEGGRRWSFVTTVDYSIIKARIGYNDPTLFEPFPYARDFFNFNILLLI